MRPDDLIRVQHILDAAREAVVYGHGQTLVTLEADKMRLLAITRLLEIIGEASATTSQETKDAHQQIPWRIMTAMRNRLIHAYFNADLKIVMDTIQLDLPPLITALEALTQSDTTDK